MLERVSGMPAASSRLHTAVRLLGETLREIGVLVLVFAPLDSLVSSSALTSRQVALMIGVAIVLIAIGVFLEVLST